MKLRHFTFAILTALIVGLTTSCSKRGEILDTIPADVTMVATLNVDKLCSAAGVTLKSDGSVDVLPAMHGVVTGDIREMLENISQLKADGAADVENIVAAVDGDGVTYLTFAVSDMDRLTAALGDNVQWSDASDGYRAARLGDTMLLCKDSQMWAVIGAKDALKSVKAMLKSAGEMSVSDLNGIAEALNRDNMANVAVASGFAALTTSRKPNTVIPAQDKEWAVGELLEGADNSLVFNCAIMQSTGRTIAPKGMQRINPALLAYVPENFNTVFAAGLTPEFDWQPLTQLAMLAGGFQTAAFLSVVTPYLESVNGSVLIAAAPASPETFAEGDFSEWDFIVMAHMPQDKINSLTSMIRNMMSTAGMTPTVTPEGLLAVPQYGKTLYIGNVDGYLGISTIGFDNTRNNSLAPTFVNKEMAASFSLEPYSAYVPSAPQGTALSLTAAMENGKTTVKIKATGTDNPALVFLLTAAK